MAKKDNIQQIKQRHQQGLVVGAILFVGAIILSLSSFGIRYEVIAMGSSIIVIIATYSRTIIATNLLSLR